MTSSSSLRVIAAAFAAGVVTACAGCGTTAPSGASQRPRAAGAGARQSLAYSEATSGAAWAVLPMGALSGPNQFWQLFVRTPGRRWSVHTPPDVATSGALAIGGLAGKSLVMAVRPSLYLGFSPVSRTADAGRHWTAGPPGPALAAVPDSLAATPGGGEILVISSAGKVSVSSGTGHGWAAVTTARSLGASPAGRACGLTRLSAVGYAPAGQRLLAGGCRHAGVVGIFSQLNGTWERAGPQLPASLAVARVEVLRLVAGQGLTTALLLARDGVAVMLAAAWLGPSGTWTVSAPLSLGSALVGPTAFGFAGEVAVVLASGRAEILSGPGGSWRATPPVPAGHAVTLALPANGPPQSLAATGGTLTIWQLGGHGSAGRSAWMKIQTVKVPIQYGSSG